MGGSNSKEVPPPPLLEEPWRKPAWTDQEKMKNKLKALKVRHPDVKYLRILVHGPVGAGKSSFINSINSMFEGRMTSAAIAEVGRDDSFTMKFQIHRIRDSQSRDLLPFVICDMMGLEKEDSGVRYEDIVSVLQGHIKDGYKFKSRALCSDEEPEYIRNPILKDKIHCLLSVISANTVGLMVEKDFEKMRIIRRKASDFNIPQLVLLTKVDQACPEVHKNIQTVYRSRKIKEKMETCSNALGVTMDCVFPVKNYHEEIDLDPDINVLLLSALTRILDSANDYVEKMAPIPE